MQPMQPVRPVRPAGGGLGVAMGGVRVCMREACVLTRTPSRGAWRCRS